jgi:hypothetical protein
LDPHGAIALTLYAKSAERWSAGAACLRRNEKDEPAREKTDRKPYYGRLYEQSREIGEDGPAADGARRLRLWCFHRHTSYASCGPPADRHDPH